MSFWDKVGTKFMFEAYKGRKFAKNMLRYRSEVKPPQKKKFTPAEKRAYQRQMRRNQLRNIEQSRKLGPGSEQTRRKRGNAAQISDACYKIHNQIQTEFDPTPKVIPPK